MVFYVTMVTFWMTLLMNCEQMLSGMMDEFIHPCLLLPTTCDEMLSRMIKTWMENHLITDNNYNTINL